MKIKYKAVLSALVIMFSMAGCSSNSSANDSIDTDEAVLIHEETVSPNEKYVESEDDIIYYNINVWQNKDNTIFVNASSNTPFFDDTQYSVDCDEQIDESDITIKWTTLMGSTESSEKDELVIGNVIISKDGKEISDKKINFMVKGINAVVDVINENSKNN
ncbi:hypothetical protein [Anaerotignum sp. MSJ-24]|uniref:hypothetical protein n=1 Tax=Anaerotignum sp. MSJ-24 TaxID=2841521 RepID=UPI001C121A5C|nr:hypothetical protein [Anaerotignum sp. MSJ-24]MBU5463776.1 hypothetical protein [Anaerotignum sp. MSJ-24]